MKQYLFSALISIRCQWRSTELPLFYRYKNRQRRTPNACIYSHFHTASTSIL